MKNLSDDHDPQTGLPGPRAFSEQCLRAAIECRRRSMPLGILALAVDETDERGHWNPLETGSVRAAVARWLRGRLRPEYFFAQIDATFFIILPAANEERTSALGRQLVEYGLELQIGETRTTISAWAGAAVVERWTEAEHDIRGALRRSLSALRLAWGGGGSSFTAHSLAHERKTRREVAIARHLPSALRRDELVLLYQPIVEVRSGRIVAVEALARWTHAELGVVTPSEFVPLAERMGSAAELDHWVLERALQEFAGLRRSFSDLDLHVNLSSVHVTSPGCAQTLLDMIDEFGIDRRAVVMELTESSAAERLEALYANMRELRDGGIRIAIDDLGSGFNSLELFAGLPCDIVKMNRTLVPAGRDDFRRRAIVEGLVRMCECLEIGLVAEGIESDEQHRLIADAGASHAQGFRYAFPALAERVVERFPDGKVALGG